MRVDRSAWSGDGDLTVRLVEVLLGVEQIVSIRVEDAPASRSGTGYNFLANEIYVAFATGKHPSGGRWLGILPRVRAVDAAKMTLPALEALLAAVEDIGPADYADQGMLQYLRTHRIVPPYQTRGYKQVELVRIYAAGTAG